MDWQKFLTHQANKEAFEQQARQTPLTQLTPEQCASIIYTLRGRFDAGMFDMHVLALKHSAPALADLINAMQQRTGQHYGSSPSKYLSSLAYTSLEKGWKTLDDAASQDDRFIVEIATALRDAVFATIDTWSRRQGPQR
jgi:hypothetical protein